MNEVIIPEFRIEDIPLSCSWIIVGPPGSGKCLAPGTPVLMFDGTIQVVEKIIAGDLIMGDDSTPCRVFGTTSGTDPMYRILQNKGEDYVVNESHVLCLKRNYTPRVSHRRLESQYRIMWMFENTEKNKNFSYKNGISQEQAHEEAELYLDSLVEGENFTRENILEISVSEYLKMASSRRGKYKGYRVGVEFQKQDIPLPFDPYIVGAWLGDGTSKQACITTSDEEIRDRIEKRLQKYNLFFDRISGTEIKYMVTSRQRGAAAGEYSVSKEHSERNAFLNFLRDANLIDNKHIPLQFKTASRTERLKFLAGLIDADGHFSNSRRPSVGRQCLESGFNSSYYEVMQKSKILAKDIAFLGRSLGFYVSMTECEKTCTNSANGPVIGTYYRLNIYGRDLHKIPVVLKRNMVNPINFRTTDESVTGITVEPLGDGQYYGFEIDGNGRFLLGDFTVTHNSTFMENICYYLKHRYPVCRAFIGTVEGYLKMCKILHPIYVSNYYDETEERKHILRQRKCEIENGKGYRGNYAVNIIDDASDDPKVYKTKTMRGLFKLGSQHWNQLLMIGIQYAIDMPPDVRKSVSYVAIFFEPEEIERKKLYNNFGGLAGSYDNFCDLMDQLTGNYTCIIFKKRTQSHKMEDNISFFQTKQLGEWKFGCKEYREWGKKRYDPNYIDQIIM